MLAAGLLLPWLLGIAAILPGRSARRSLAAPGEIAWIAGTGYLAGAFLVMLWMRALSATNVGFEVGTIGAPLLALGIALGMYVRRRDGDAALLATRAALSTCNLLPRGRRSARATSCAAAGTCCGTRCSP
jgi:hypothetical protein